MSPTAVTTSPLIQQQQAFLVLVHHLLVLIQPLLVLHLLITLRHHLQVINLSISLHCHLFNGIPIPVQITMLHLIWPA